MATRRWVVRALCLAPAYLTLDDNLLGQVSGLLQDGSAHSGMQALLLFALGVAPAIGVALALRDFLSAALAPLLDRAEIERKDADGLTFSAVAVTPESRAAVGLLAVVSVGVLGVLAGTRVGFGETGLSIALAYAGVAFVTVVSFQRASRIAIGLDGVRVSGSSLLRFHAYRDADSVDVTREGDVALRRHGKVVLRLQLHGEDVGRRAPIVARLRDAIARAHAPGGDARRLAEAASPALLAQAARGDGDYRSPAAPRDALWEVIEAPSARGDARVRARAGARGGRGRGGSGAPALRGGALRGPRRRGGRSRGSRRRGRRRTRARRVASPQRAVLRVGR